MKLATLLTVIGLLVLAPGGAGAAREAGAAQSDTPAPDKSADEVADAVARMRTRATALREQAQVALERGAKLGAATALFEAGQIDFTLGDLHSCRRAHEAVVELARELDHAFLHTVATAHLGAVHEQCGELKDAREKLQEALSKVGNVPGQQRPPVEVFVLSYLGAVQLEEGEVEAARATFERALELTATDSNPTSGIVLRSRMAQVCTRSGEPAEAAAWHAEALQLARSFGHPESLAQALLNAGRFHEERSEFAPAREMYREAYEKAQLARTRNAVLGHLGSIAMRTGDAETALEHYSDVLAYARRTGDRGLERSALLAISHAGHRLGDLDLALRHIEEVLLSLGGDSSPALRAESLRFLALVLQERGDLETPRAKLEEALQLARRANDRLLEGVVLAGQVALAYHRQEYAQGMLPARALLDIGRELGFPDIEATGLRNLAELNLRLGEVERAHELSEQATALFRQIGDRRELQSALLTSVEIAAARGDTQAMSRIVSEAEACFLDAPRLDPERGALLRSREIFALWGEHAQDLVSRTLASSSSPAVRREAIEEGFRRAGTWKGRALWDGIAEHRRGARNARTVALRKQHDDMLAAREDVLLSLRDALRANAPSTYVAELRTRLDELEERSREITARLAALSPTDAALDAFAGTSPDELAHVLQDRVLIEFVDGRRDLYAYVLKDGRLDFREIGERDGIDARVTTFLDGITRRETLDPPALVARRGRALHDELCGALLQDVPASAALVVVPSASLAALPFEALVVDAPERPSNFAEITFVLDRREVSYAASTPVLALLASATPRRTAGRALVLGDPLSGDEGARVAGQGFARLPGTRHEALAIATELEARSTEDDTVSRDGGVAQEGLIADVRDERSLSLQGETVSLRLGADATPQCFQGDLRAYSILHCASHGWLDRRDPRRSGLVLSPDPDGKALVSLTQILDLDLDLDLAVLSACDTARGAIQSGEGVRSLATAFQHAGARSVVASLWPVEDRATEQVMVAFHRANADGGVTVSRALRDARLAVRHGTVPEGVLRGRPVVTPPPRAENLAGHPYYWAAFVLSGPPRATITAR